jgi:hypothetical protein
VAGRREAEGEESVRLVEKKGGTGTALPVDGGILG